MVMKRFLPIPYIVGHASQNAYDDENDDLNVFGLFFR
jgi:hypothetical protein